MDRRHFVAGAAAGSAFLASGLARSAQAAPTYRHSLKLASIIGRPDAQNLKAIKDAGLDGVETTAIVAPAAAGESRKIAEDMGLRIHSVLRGWAEFNSPDPKVVEGSWQASAAALRAAAGYGADAVLLVPCRVGGMAMPQAWDFKIKFDAATGHLISVADGDNAPYKDYIAAQDRAWDTSTEQINKLIDVAKETGVVIALENVWNNLWVDPHHFAAFVKSFHSPWVKGYFDIGNMVKYSKSEIWIRALGKDLAKCHVKDFKLNANGQGGDWKDPLDGSVDWPEVRRALDEVDYDGWLTIEGSGGLGLPEIKRRMALIAQGGK